MTAVRENGAASGVGVLTTWRYDDWGRRHWQRRGNGTETRWAYAANSRDYGVTHDQATHDVTTSLAFSPAPPESGGA